MTFWGAQWAKRQRVSRRSAVVVQGLRRRAELGDTGLWWDLDGLAGQQRFAGGQPARLHGRGRDQFRLEVREHDPRGHRQHHRGGARPWLRAGPRACRDGHRRGHVLLTSRPMSYVPRLGEQASRSSRGLALRQTASHDGRPLDPARRSGPVPGRGGGPAPSRAARSTGGGGWPGRSDPVAGGGLDGVLRGARVRHPLWHAAPDGGAAMPRRGLPAGRCPGLLGGVRAGHGDAADLPRRGRGAGLGRGLPGRRDRRPGTPGGGHPGRGAGADGSGLLHRHRREQAPGEAGDRVRQTGRHLSS